MAVRTAADPVRELRLVLTVDDWPAAVRFYRDALGLDQVADFSSDEGQVVLLAAGRATLEVIDARQAAYIDRVEVGRRIAGRVRVGVEVGDVVSTADRLSAAGAEVLAPPTRTPWDSRNARLEVPGLQLTLFESSAADPTRRAGELTRSSPCTSSWSGRESAASAAGTCSCATATR
jgi:lactoylglutathione lyase